MTPQQEFNLQGLDPLRTTLTAGLLALPGIIAAGYQYGWQGIAVASLFTAGLTHHINRHSGQVAASEAAARAARANDNPETAPWEARLQALADTMTGQLGMKPVTLRVLDDPRILARAEIYTRHVEIGYWLTQVLDEKELKWVIAHELDHILHPSDTRTRAAFHAAAKINLCLLGSSILSFMGLPSLSQGFPGLLGINYLAIDASLKHADAALSRQSEYRCDANALRLTGDYNAAHGALHKIWLHAERMNVFDKLFFRMSASGDDNVIVLELPDIPPKKSFWQEAREFLTEGDKRSHPDLTRRMANIERTWKKMQAEGRTTPEAPHA